MAPAAVSRYTAVGLERRLPQRRPTAPDALVLEAWAQGYLVGSLIIMAAITIANMRRKVLLHKLILLELFLGCFHGTFIFNHAPAYGWYLSATAVLLNISWSLHNVIAWMKTKPFLSRKWSMFYIITVILVQPYWVLEIYANWAHFNNLKNSNLFIHTRPYEALFRDPWWIFSVANLYWNLVRTYHLSIHTIVYISPRFGVLLASMLISICFIIVDVCSVTGVFATVLPDGLNPFWKLAMVFKCLCDSIVLDDFKTALDRLKRYKLWRDNMDAQDAMLDMTLRTVDEIGEDRAQTKATIDPLGEDAAEKGEHMATLQKLSNEIEFSANFPKAPLPVLDTVLSPEELDQIDLPEYMSGSGSSGPKGPRDSNSTSQCARSSWGKDFESHTSSSKRHSSMAFP